jgi:uncharacterized membrane protein
MNRTELDAFVEHHELSPVAVELALELTRSRASALETREFAIRALRLAGALSLAAGVIFFVAANWQELHVAGRFALLQILLLGGIAAALWQPPPLTLGRFGMLASFIMTGALLALFGQTYQTGADVYELFLTWTLLGAVFAIAGQWSVVLAAWVFVLNVALALYCGLRPQGGLFWALLGPLGLSDSYLLLWPTAANLLLWLGGERARNGQFAHLAPRWLRRFVLACAMAFATWAGVVALFTHEFGGRTSGDVEVAPLVLIAIALAAVAIHTLRQRTDVFPLTSVAASVIVLGTCAIARANDSGGVGLLFVMALWLVVASTAAGRMLVGRVREWRVGENAA